MEEIIFVNFKVTDRYYGYPDPYIADQTCVILIQDDTIEICKYHKPTDDNPFPSFSHASNNEELKELAIRIVKEKFPQYVEYTESIVLTCQEFISNKVVW
ncbi:hypothetical protein [Xanthocytophaga flava]|uniref:hypothetical protein n=1 Tax=Xanthocytophaga flava TaxID=3048013 RepID=UPI0028D220D8|nr:hypothetical protein [Xanthocytophaga flavus]MDJ1467261.1 hypothetical protein [Xanthocytophaga flavus]